MAILWNTTLLSQGVMMPVLMFLSMVLLGYRWLSQRMRGKVTQIPGPNPLPIIGNAHSFAAFNLNHTLKTALKMFELFGPVFTVWIGPVQLVATASVAINEKVLTNRSIRNRGPFVHKVAGEMWLQGILVASNERWRVHRKILVSTLHHNVLQRYVKTYASKAMDVAQKLRTLADGSAVDIHMLFIQCTLNIVCETMVGTSLSAALTNDVKFITVMLRVMENFAERGRKPWMMIDWIYKRTQLDAMAILWNTTLLSQGVMTPVLMFLSMALLGYCWLRQRMRDKATRIPGPNPLPIIGNAHSFATFNLNQTTKAALKMFETYGPVFTVWIGPVQLVATASVAINEKVLTNRSIRNRGPFIHKVGKEMLFQGILVASNERWRVHRKILVSAIHHNVLQRYVKTYASRAMDVAQKLRTLADGSPVDIHMLFIQCTLNIICETMVGTSLSAALTNDVKFITVMLRQIENLAERAKKPWMMIDWIYKRTQLGKQNQEDLKYFHGKLREVISEKKRLLEEKNLKSMDLSDGESIRRRDLCFIDLLLMDGQMTEEDILGECACIVAAGSDTTSWTTCYVLTLLAEHPDVQEKIMLEQNQIFHSEDFQRPVEPEDLPRMTYLEQVIKETLRLYSLVPFVIRHMERDTDIGDGITAPAGSYVLLSNFVTHRDERYFPDPMKFDPDRFAPENEGKIHPYAYFPFGGGQRICLGYKLAIMEMKSILSTVLRHVQVTDTVANMATLEDSFAFGVVLKPTMPIRLRFSPRKVN